MAVSVPPSEQTSGKRPPQNQEAEVSVLGSILLSEQALDGILIDVKLRPDDFYRPRHGVIFGAMIRLKEKSDPEPVDVLTVSDELERGNQLEEVGGREYVHSLPNLVPAAANARHYARIVKEHAMLRRLLDTTRGIQEEVFGFAGEPHELLEKAEAQLYRIAHDDRTGELRSIEAILHDELAKLERVSREGVAITGTPSGFKDIDDLTGGFQPGNLIVLAARPAMGKSALVTNIAQNAAVDHNRGIALFSLEMSETELAQRFIAAEAKLNGDDLRKGRVRPDRWPKVVKATEKLHAAPLYVDDSSDMGVMEMRAKARRLHAREPLGLVIVDYLQLMRPEAGADSRVEQIGQISRGLKLLARELNIPVIAVSQLSRAVEQRPDKRPLLSDLRESGCLTGDSLVYLPDEGRRRPIRELDGVDGVAVLAVNPETWKLERRKARGFRTGRKPVYRITTSLGRTIRATANHKFLTISGWRRLDELEPDDHIATRTESGTHAHTPTELGESAGVGTAVAVRPKTGQLAVGDVYWDQVRTIEPAGVEDVYDLTVEGLHNFVADEIVVHNSIEQDADLVMFIYRDEYYNKESERPGEADIIVSKHRNGPIGDVTLTFLARYPKFANMYKPPPGGGPPPMGGNGGNGSSANGGDAFGDDDSFGGPRPDLPPPPPSDAGSEDDPW